ISVIDQADSDDFATIGVAIHPLGDSFSHRQMGDEKFTYEQGLGHAKHGTDPDTIHLRREKYEGYVESLATILAKKRGVDITAEELGGLQSDLWSFVESAKVPKANIIREYTYNGSFQDIRYPIVGTVDDELTNENTIKNLRMKAIDEYAKRKGITTDEVKKQILKPEENSFPLHGFFSKGKGGEVSDIIDLLQTQPTEDNFILDYWKKRKDAKQIFEKLDPAVEKVASEVIKLGIEDK
ncbi:hypothetical protein, partial [Zooshikella harenae]